MNAYSYNIIRSFDHMVLKQFTHNLTIVALKQLHIAHFGKNMQSHLFTL